jgi:hypothetical protein
VRDLERAFIHFRVDFNRAHISEDIPIAHLPQFPKAQLYITAQAVIVGSSIWEYIWVRNS